MWSLISGRESRYVCPTGLWEENGNEPTAEVMGQGQAALASGRPSLASTVRGLVTVGFSLPSEGASERPDSNEDHLLVGKNLIRSTVGTQHRHGPTISPLSPFFWVRYPSIKPNCGGEEVVNGGFAAPVI